MGVRAFIKRFNRKLYDSDAPNETNWSRWYFPVINTDKSLKELDTYMQECLRYTASKTHKRKVQLPLLADEGSGLPQPR